MYLERKAKLKYLCDACDAIGHAYLDKKVDAGGAWQKISTIMANMRPDYPQSEGMTRAHKAFVELCKQVVKQDDIE